jgi:uncharacterized protein (TIGR02246 family)
MTPATSIDEFAQRFREAFLATDLDALAALYEEDAIFYSPKRDAVWRGPSDIVKMFGERFAVSTPIDLRGIEREEFSDGDYAVTHGVYELRERANDSGEERTWQARTTEVLHRGADGGWRMVIDHAS